MHPCAPEGYSELYDFFIYEKYTLCRYFVVNIINIWGLSLEPPFPLWVIIKISNKPHVNYGFTIFTFDFCIIFQTLFIVCNNVHLFMKWVYCVSVQLVFSLWTCEIFMIIGYWMFIELSFSFILSLFIVSSQSLLNYG